MNRGVYLRFIATLQLKKMVNFEIIDLIERNTTYIGFMGKMTYLQKRG
jgi:hypothetical protein